MTNGSGGLDKKKKTGPTSAFRSTQKKKKCWRATFQNSTYQFGGKRRCSVMFNIQFK